MLVRFLTSLAFGAGFFTIVQIAALSEIRILERILGIKIPFIRWKNKSVCVAGEINITNLEQEAFLILNDAENQSNMYRQLGKGFAGYDLLVTLSEDRTKLNVKPRQFIRFHWYLFVLTATIIFSPMSGVVWGSLFVFFLFHDLLGRTFVVAHLAEKDSGDPPRGLGKYPN